MWELMFAVNWKMGGLPGFAGQGYRDVESRRGKSGPRVPDTEVL